MDTHYWTQHFEQNAIRSASLRLPETSCELPDAVRLPLARSLATFQLGESGGGTRLRRYARGTPAFATSPGYRRAIDLFITEEQGHSELLGRVVDYLGGKRIQKQWTNSIFRRLRFLAGLEFTIQVLLTAELIAEAYYGTLYLRVADPVVRTMAGKILADEVKHLQFQRDFLTSRLSHLPPGMRTLWRWQFHAVHCSVAWVVSLDHAGCLTALGVRPAEFRRRCRQALARFQRRLDKGLPDSASESRKSVKTSPFPARLS